MGFREWFVGVEIECACGCQPDRPRPGLAAFVAEEETNRNVEVSGGEDQGDGHAGGIGGWT